MNPRPVHSCFMDLGRGRNTWRSHPASSCWSGLSPGPPAAFLSGTRGSIQELYSLDTKILNQIHRCRVSVYTTAGIARACSRPFLESSHADQTEKRKKEKRLCEQLGNQTVCTPPPPTHHHHHHHPTKASHFQLNAGIYMLPRAQTHCAPRAKRNMHMHVIRSTQRTLPLAQIASYISGRFIICSSFLMLNPSPKTNSCNELAPIKAF